MSIREVMIDLGLFQNFPGIKQGTGRGQSRKPMTESYGESQVSFGDTFIHC